MKKIKALFKDEVLEIGINTEQSAKRSDDVTNLDKAIENVEHDQNLAEFTGEEFE